MEWKKGSELNRKQQEDVLASFVYRFTGSHKPEWAYSLWKDGQSYPLQFKNDRDWLINTEFAVTAAGDLDRQIDYCHSNPTWPLNPELRLKAA